MAKAMGLKHGIDAGFHHIIDVALQKAAFLQFNQEYTIGKLMHFDPIGPWTGIFMNGLASGQNDIVNESLIFGEFPVGWKTARDISTVPKVIGTHIE